MELFGVGGFEFALVIIIALIVAGPARMAVWARKLGQWTGQLRNLWRSAAGQLQKELDEAGVDFKVPKELPTRRAIMDEINRSPAVKEFAKPIKEVQAALEEGQVAANEVGGALRSVERKMLDATAANKPESPAEPRPGIANRSAGVTPALPASKPNGAGGGSTGFGTWGGGDAESRPAQDSFGTWAQAPKDE